MRVFNFSHNWNNKLDCNQFSTIRLRNDYKNVVGDIAQVKYKHETFNVQVVYISHFPFSKLNDGMTRIDMDLPIDKARTVLERMYSKKVPNINKQQFSFIVLKKLRS